MRVRRIFLEQVSPPQLAAAQGLRRKELRPLRAPFLGERAKTARAELPYPSARSISENSSADVSRFTSNPHVWSHRQVAHLNVGEKNAYPLSCHRHFRDHPGNWCNPGRSWRVSVLPARRRLCRRGRLWIHQLPAMSGQCIGPHGLLRDQSSSRKRRRPDNSSQAASSLTRLRREQIRWLGPLRICHTARNRSGDRSGQVRYCPKGDLLTLGAEIRIWPKRTTSRRSGTTTYAVSPSQLQRGREGRYRGRPHFQICRIVKYFTAPNHGQADNAA
jgi:hypothetical protein